MKFFIMMCGISGSGKSTTAQQYKDSLGAGVISSDSLREELFGDANDQTHNNEVFIELHKRVREYLEAGRSVVYDATNLTYKDRAKALLDISRIKDVIKVCIVCSTPIETCIDNDAKRNRTVGEEVIKHQVSKFNMPQVYEGWDSIIITNPVTHKYIPEGVISMNLYNKEEVDKTFQMMRGFDQQNPHHVHDLLGHCLAVYEAASRRGLTTAAREAAAFHDVGKMFTKKLDDKGVAHYYSHENWSAYYILTHPEVVDVHTIKEFLELLFIVNNHMHIREIDRSEKAKRNHIARWGQEWYDELVAFSECDNIGSGRTYEEHQKIKNGENNE